MSENLLFFMDSKGWQSDVTKTAFRFKTLESMLSAVSEQYIWGILVL